MTIWRIHRKYRGYSVWAYETRETEVEAYDATMAKAAFIGRQNIPICSIVDSDKVTRAEQEEQDRDKPDGFYDVICFLPPEELEKLRARWQRDGLAAAESMMKSVNDSIVAHRAVMAARKKRRAQIADNMGQFKNDHPEQGDYVHNQFGFMEAEREEAGHEIKKDPQAPQYDASTLRRTLGDS